MIAEILVVAAEISRGTPAIFEAFIQATVASALLNSQKRVRARRQFREAKFTATHVSLRYAVRLIAVASSFSYIRGI